MIKPDWLLGIGAALALHIVIAQIRFDAPDHANKGALDINGERFANVPPTVRIRPDNP